MTRKNISHGYKYYQPTQALVDSLMNELHYLEAKISRQSAGEELSKKRNAISQRKFDAISRVFQSLVDIVFFLEFIEDHHELHEVYEDVLKDLFGISHDDSYLQPSHYKNRGSSLFSRFISASIFHRWSYSDGEHHYNPIDFRVLLIKFMMDIIAKNMKFRLSKDLRESQLFTNNIENALLWSELLASRYKDKPRTAHRRIGYCIPITYQERREIRKLEKDNSPVT